MRVERSLAARLLRRPVQQSPAPLVYADGDRVMDDRRLASLRASDDSPPTTSQAS